MSVKREKYRIGPFEHGWVEADLSDPGYAEAVRVILESFTPRSAITRWRPHAERLGVARELLDQAEALVDGNDSLADGDRDRFGFLVLGARLAIEQQQNERLDVYGLAGKRARQREKQKSTMVRRNESRDRQAKIVNEKLIVWDDELKDSHPRLNQVQRAEKIIKQHSKELGPKISATQPASLVSRIRRARKQ